MTRSPTPHWLSSPAPGAACAIVAEIAQAHDGSLGQAHAYIDCAAKAGADAVKFQTHIAAAESTASEPWRVKFSPQDATRFEYWKRMEFTPEQWAGLKSHAEDKGLVFLSSPFSAEAAAMLHNLGMVAWKVASGELTNLPLIRQMAQSGKPVMLSTGMSPFAEIDAAVDIVRAANTPLAVFQCTSKYPSPPESIGLNVLDELRARYNCAVGLSDHSGKIYPALAARAAHRAEIIEIHLTMSRDMFGPDVPASVTPQELHMISEGIRFIEEMQTSPVDKSAVDDNIAAMRKIFFKSIVASRNLPAGTVLLREHLSIKKPANGIPASDIDSVIGKTLMRAVERDMPLKFEDIKSP